MKLITFILLTSTSLSKYLIQLDLDAEDWHPFENQQLSAETLKQFPNQLRWDHTPQQIKEISMQLITNSTQDIDSIINLKEPRNFANTIEPLAKWEAEVAVKSSNLAFYKNVATNKEIRTAAMEHDKEFGKMRTSLWMKESLFHAVQDYKKAALADKTWEKLDHESQRYVDKVLNDFETGGMKLNEEGRKHLIEMENQIHELEEKAEANINEDKSKVAFKKEELKGMSQQAIDKLDKVPNQEGMVYLSLGKTEIGPNLKHLELSDTRKKIDYAMGIQDKDSNVPLIEQLVELRQQKALLLGYNSYSEMVLTERMAKNVETVQLFEDDLVGRIIQKGRNDQQELLEFKRKEDKDQNAILNKWDHSFYGSKLKKQTFNFDEEKLKDYFPSENVKVQTMNIYQELLGLEFNKLPDAQTWHKEVSCYEVKDKQNHNILGHFYLDLYPRPDKYNHAAAFALTKRAVIDNKILPAASAMVTNFNPPTKDKPSLLQHSQVVTFFHEFGHVMHHMCSEANYSRFSGTSVERDFVEMPSQMLENWIWDKDILKKVSKHYKTGEPLPDDIIDKKLASKNAHIASETLDQIFYGTLDLLLYSASDKKLLSETQNATGQALMNAQNLNAKGLETISQMRHEVKHKNDFVIDTEELWHKLAQKIELTDYQEGTNPIGAFGHLISGYTSQYYGYLWSQVYSSDLFAQFKQHGLLNPDIGMKYRKEILAPGGSRDSAESLQIFLGREPNNQAFLLQNNFMEEIQPAADLKKQATKQVVELKKNETKQVVEVKKDENKPKSQVQISTPDDGDYHEKESRVQVVSDLDD